MPTRVILSRIQLRLQVFGWGREKDNRKKITPLDAGPLEHNAMQRRASADPKTEFIRKKKTIRTGLVSVLLNRYSPSPSTHRMPTPTRENFHTGLSKVARPGDPDPLILVLRICFQWNRNQQARGRCHGDDIPYTRVENYVISIEIHRKHKKQDVL